MAKNEIGENIKFFRKENKLTQKQLADLIGVSYQQISQYECGKRNPKIDTLRKIASALNVPLPYFLPLENEEEKHEVISSLTKEELSEYLEEQKEFKSFMLEDVISAMQDQEWTLLAAFYKLNSAGKKVAIQRIEELSEIEKYTEDFSNPDSQYYIFLSRVNHFKRDSDTIEEFLKYFHPELSNPSDDEPDQK